MYLHEINVVEICDEFPSNPQRAANLLKVKLARLALLVSTRTEFLGDVEDDYCELMNIFHETEMLGTASELADLKDILEMLKDWGNTVLGRGMRLCNVVGNVIDDYDDMFTPRDDIPEYEEFVPKEEKEYAYA